MMASEMTQTNMQPRLHDDANPTLPEFSRRHFLRWVAISAGGFVASQLTGCGDGSSATSITPQLSEPPVLRSSNGLLSMDLVAAYTYQPMTLAVDRNSNTYPSPKTSVDTALRRYSGSFPAPTLRVKPGDTIQIRLINRLPPSPSGQSSLEFMNHQNSTNLHFHGLHVDPKKRVTAVGEIFGDYVVDTPDAGVLPGAERLHDIKIPEDHAPGIFWYHPHLHGSTASQVSSGMFGAIIVEGSANELFDPQLATERIIFVHKHNLSSSGRTDSFIETATSNPSGFLLNGTSQPTMTLRPGEVQIWHFINSATVCPFNPVLDGHTMQAFARDGDPIPEGFRPINTETVTRFNNQNWPNNIQGWPGTLASPGSRVSVLVKASDTPGEYFLRSALSPWTANPSVPLYEEIVARVLIQGQPVQIPMPSVASFTPHADFAPITDAELAGSGGQTRNLVLGMFGLKHSRIPKPIPVGEGWFLPENEGGELFGNVVFATGDNSDPASLVAPFQSASALSQTVRLDDVEEWTVTNPDPFPHPFHIHVNDMYVVKINDQRLDQPYWVDTLLIPSRGSITFRMRFKDFDGSFVWHCHILEHEDMGMMQLVTVV